MYWWFQLLQQTQDTYQKSRSTDKTWLWIYAERNINLLHTFGENLQPEDIKYTILLRVQSVLIGKIARQYIKTECETTSKTKTFCNFLKYISKHSSFFYSRISFTLLIPAPLFLLSIPTVPIPFFLQPQFSLSSSSYFFSHSPSFTFTSCHSYLPHPSLIWA